MLSEFDNAFTFITAEYLLSGSCAIEEGDGEDKGFLRLRAEDVVSNYGPELCNELAENLLNKHKKDGGMKKRKGAEGFIRATINSTINKTPSKAVLYKKRKRSARIEYTFVDASLVGTFPKSPPKKKASMSPSKLPLPLLFWS